MLLKVKKFPKMIMITLLMMIVMMIATRVMMKNITVIILTQVCKRRGILNYSLIVILILIIRGIFFHSVT